MSSRHLGCRVCRIRVRSSAYGYDLLEGGCPICGAKLTPVSSAAGVIGFRLFDFDVLSEQELSGPPPTLGQIVNLVGGREAAPARDDEWPAAH
jgi:hypothetical protein